VPHLQDEGWRVGVTPARRTRAGSVTPGWAALKSIWPAGTPRCGSGNAAALPHHRRWLEPGRRRPPSPGQPGAAPQLPHRGGPGRRRGGVGDAGPGVRPGQDEAGADHTRLTRWEHGAAPGV